MKVFLTILLALFFSSLTAQSSKTEVMTLGVFHFNFPNLDVNKINKSDQIDVLEPVFQNEIEDIVNKIARFKPTIVIIERQPSEQPKIDSIFQQYLAGNYQLKRSEEEQIGFRLAKRFGLKKLYCVDEWGNFNNKINQILNGKDSIESKKFEAYFENNPDKPKRFINTTQFKTIGILASLREYNDEINIKRSLGNYLIGLFKYESQEKDFTGVDFETGRWFNRNLKIFRNIQRIEVNSSDKILIIYGAGHLNLLNYFFDCSPEFMRVNTNNFLK
ncbi:DUF5694 domain-containing protein [Sediminibacterium sp.]|uniref:DUF5694 domain-containing protein n=1 Tax=Sediminibacterium sp. TaxID=1917865 RepID=UPI0027336A4D|nr:DUF5694 domain-containing protein [Sediminibacterium sp.]MDP3393727.1 DUF5694 domain-containing protein [Sediminibacterium sp.]MDP3566500.1 DUF5694 domain-containing protein [Sediminibacterium sp.]